MATCLAVGQDGVGLIFIGRAINGQAVDLVVCSSVTINLYRLHSVGFCIS